MLSCRESWFRVGFLKPMFASRGGLGQHRVGVDRAYPVRCYLGRLHGMSVYVNTLLGVLLYRPIDATPDQHAHWYAGLL